MREKLHDSFNFQVNILDYNIEPEMEQFDKIKIFPLQTQKNFIQKFNTPSKVIQFFETSKENNKIEKNKNIYFPYLKITKKGLLISTIDMFPILKEKTNFFRIDENFWEKFKIRYLFWNYEMMTLNGVKGVSKDSIEFYNEDRFFFNNSERKFSNLLGLFIHKKEKELVFAYWSHFLKSSSFLLAPKINLKENSLRKIKKFENFLKMNKRLLNVELSDIDNMKKMTVFFSADWMRSDVSSLDKNDAFSYKGEWFNGKPFGNGTVGWVDKDSGLEVAVRGFWYENQFYSDNCWDSDEFTALIQELEQYKGFKNFLQEQIDNYLRPLPSIASMTSDLETLKDKQYSMKKFSIYKEKNFKIVYNDQTLETIHQFCFKMFKKFRKVALEVKNKKRRNSDFAEIYNSINSKKNEGELTSIKIFYPNGDTFTGKVNKFGFKIGEGRYLWKKEGFIYKGNFFANLPIGYGQLKSALGKKKSGFFYYGFLLKKPYGIEKYLENRLKKGNDECVDLLSMEIMSNPTLGETLINQNSESGIKINYDNIFRDIENFKEFLREERGYILDGELDLIGRWRDVTSDVVKRQIFIENSIEISGKKEKNSVKKLESIKELENDFNESSESLTVKRDLMMEKKEVGEEKKDGKDFFLGKYFWMKKNGKGIEIEKLNRFEKEILIEMVRDEDLEGLKIFSQNLKKSARNLKKFFGIRDRTKRNLLQISGYRGHRTVFLDLMTLLFRSEIPIIEIMKILKVEDIDKNSVIDLICIRGFEVEDSMKYYQNFDYKDPRQNYLFKHLKQFKQFEIGIGDESESIIKSNIPKILLEIDFLLNHEKRQLFSKSIQTEGDLCEEINSVLKNEELKTSEIFLMTNRSICLFALIKAINILKEKAKVEKKLNLENNIFDILVKEKYENKKNNPLYFTFYWGDLHSTLYLLREKPDMIFWKNYEFSKENWTIRETAPQVIKRSGDNMFRSRVIFASVLNEITRLFNFKLVKKILRDKIYKNLKEKKNHKIDKSYQILRQNHTKLKKSEIRTIFEKLGKKKFQIEENPLYNNNYILLSDELCRQYLKNLRKNSQFLYFKNENPGTTDKFVHNYSSEIQSMQHNFLDFYSPEDFSDRKKNSKREHGQLQKLRKNAKLILSWYIYIFGNADINPKIYTQINIDPFELVFDQKNIFHIMCEHNSYSLLRRFIDYFKKKSKSELKNWKRKFKEKLNIGSGDTLETPAHLCVVFNSINCLEILVSEEIDIDIPNLRGRTVRELLRVYEPFNLNEEGNSRRVDNFESQIVEYLSLLILSTCQQHSIKYEFLESSHQNLMDLLDKSDYELKLKFRKFKGVVLDKLERILKDWRRVKEELATGRDFLKKIVQGGGDMEEMALELMNKKMKKFLNPFVALVGIDKKSNGLFGSKIVPQKKDKKTMASFATFGEIKKSDPVKQLNALIIKAILSSEKVLTIPNDLIFKKFLESYSKISKIKYRYKKFEKISKNNFLKKFKKIDFRSPLPRGLKYHFSIDSLFCIEIKLQESEKLENHIVLLQINNIRKKYLKYGGALKLEIIKGHSSFLINTSLKKEKFTTYYILIKLTDSLLKHMAIQNHIKTFNMKKKFETLILDNFDSLELEPLRNYQKVNIMMKLIKTEFNINIYKEKGILVKYFPIHNYIERKNFENFFKTRWEMIVFILKHLSGTTEKICLKFFSHLSFYHGIQQGFYLAFFTHMTAHLLFLAIIGCFLLVFEYFFFKSQVLRGGMIFFVGIWSTWVMSMWGRREKELAYNFEVGDEKRVLEIRDKYTGKAVINEATFKVSKKSRDNLLFRYLLTLFVSAVGAIPILLLYWMVTFLNTEIEKNRSLSVFWKSVYTSGVAAMNGTLNFIASLVYNKLAAWAVEQENHALITKRVTFRLYAAMFTLVVSSFLEKGDNFMFFQVLLNLLITAALNVGLNFGVPHVSFSISRYSPISALYGGTICCRSKRVGKLDRDREEILNELYSNKKLRPAVVKYIFGDGNSQPPHLWKKEEKEKINEKVNIEKKATNHFLVDKLANFMVEESLLPQNQEKKGKKSNEGRKVDNNQNVERKNNDENITRKNLGENKEGNIKNRIRERKKKINLSLEYIRHVLEREKIIETSYMLDLSLAEENLHTALLTQFTFICFFVTQFPYAGLVSFIINLPTFFITIKMYSYFSRRTISERSSSLGIWKKFYETISYLGIVFNALTATRGAESESFSLTFKKLGIENSTFFIYNMQIGLLVGKFLLAILVPAIPVWVYNRVVRQEQRRARSLQGKIEGGKERLEDENLRFFFSNQNDVENFVTFDEVKNEEKREFEMLNLKVEKKDLFM